MDIANDIYKKSLILYNRIKNMMLKTDDEIIFAYSGGKDSSLVIHTALKVIKNNINKILKKERPLSIIYIDTGVEIPLYKTYVEKQLNKIKDWIIVNNLEDILRVNTLRPSIDKSFWYYLFVKGYPMPTYFFRWCTNKLKITPMKNYLLNHRPSVLVLASKNKESSSRYRSIKKRQKSKLWGSYDGFPDVKVFYPIIDWSDEEVFQFLRFTKRAIFEENYSSLLNIYDMASNGGKYNARFGCWVCTVITKDKTLINLYNSGYELSEDLLQFKRYLFEESRKPNNRVILPNGRAGKIKKEVRLRLFKDFKFFVEKVKYQYGIELISEEEIMQLQHVIEEEMK